MDMTTKRWALVAIAATTVLALLGLGFAAMSTNPPFIVPNWVSLVFFVLAGLVALGTVMWLLLTRNKEIKIRNAELLADIKTDSVNMGVIERNIATKISSEINLTKKAVLRICSDYTEALGDVFSKMIDIILNKDYDALIQYCHTVGKILDANKVGLKIALVDNELYKAAKLDLEQKRLLLKLDKKHKFTKPNIARVERLSYGVNSHAILRGIFAKYPEYMQGVAVEIRLALEEIENASESTLSTMLEDLEGDWSKENKK